ncbi:MAG: DUF4870 domain-containing protein [Anaerolineales bacterium]|nr:DUF4870 domain-containing protein [Anaerolineales bacterium]
MEKPLETAEEYLPSSEERLWAALSHGAVILVGWGLVVPALVWTMQRQKSPQVAFQALQALAYQLFYTVYIFVVSLCLTLFLSLAAVGLFMAAESSSSGEPPLLIMLSQFLFMIILLGALGLYFLLGVVGAGMCLAGKKFHYPLLGRWIERYLRRSAAQPVEEAV